MPTNLERFESPWFWHSRVRRSEQGRKPDRARQFALYKEMITKKEDCYAFIVRNGLASGTMEWGLEIFKVVLGCLGRPVEYFLGKGVNFVGQCVQFGRPVSLVSTHTQRGQVPVFLDVRVPLRNIEILEDMSGIKPLDIRGYEQCC
jgi:hypothetical protein